MSDEKRGRIVDELTKSKGYDIALLTTFNFETEYFERAILSRLFSCGTRKVSLFVDASELTKALATAEVSNIGRKYAVNPVRIKSTFHPKVALLVGKRCAKLIVSSANIKTSGYEVNNEIFNVFAYDEKNQRYSGLIRDALDFFLELDKLSYELDTELINEARRLVRIEHPDENENIRLVHNLNQPIMDQVVDKTGKKVQEIRIAVPYYDNKLLALKEMKKTFRNAAIQLFIQNHTSTFPVKLNRRENIVDKIRVFDGFNDTSSETSSNFYHGKVFSFRTDKEIIMLYGSANCTKSALLTSGETGGNIECCILASCKKSEQDAFFSTMNITDRTGRTIESSPMRFEKEEIGNFYYKYGEFSDELVLHIGMGNEVNGLKILIGGVECTYAYNDKEVIVRIENELASRIPSVFNIEMKYAEASEMLVGWYINQFDLLQNRINNASQNVAIYFDPDADSAKYMEDVMELLKAYATCAVDLLEQKKALASYDRLKKESSGDNVEEDDESFIVDFDIQDEYTVQYRRYNEVQRIQTELINGFKNGIYLSIPKYLEKEKNTGKNGKSEKGPEGSTARNRQPTTADKRFSRFIRGQVKNMCEGNFVAQVDTRAYLGAVLVHFHTFDKRVELFAPEFIISSKAVLLQNLLKIYASKKDDDLSDITDPIQKCVVDTIIHNHELIVSDIDEPDRYIFDNLNRDLLLKVDDMFSVRGRTDNIIDEICEGKRMSGLSKRKGQWIKYLNNLFGFMDDSLLRDYIQSLYGKSAELEINQNVARIKYETDCMGEHRRPNPELLKEIEKYSHNVHEITTTKVEVLARKTPPNIANPEIRFLHTIDMRYHRLTVHTERKNGKTEDVRVHGLVFM